MQPSEAICKTCIMYGEWCGWCPECREWKILHGELRDFGVCGECREALIDSIWDRSSFVLEEIMTKYQYCVPETFVNEASDIRADMARVMGVPRK